MTSSSLGGVPLLSEIRHNRVVEFELTGASRRVARQILDGGPASASELCERLQLSPTAVRRHLDSLESRGIIESSEKAPFGPIRRRGRGRPAKVYSLSTRGRGIFDQAYDDIAIQAMEYIARDGGPEAIERFAQARSADLRDRLAMQVDAEEPVRVKVEQLAGALYDEGFAATVEDAGDSGIQMCQHHCPIAHVAEKYPELCEAETEALAEVLGTHVTRLATIGHGDGVCTTHIPLSGRPSSQANVSTKNEQGPKNKAEAEESRKILAGSGAKS